MNGNVDLPTPTPGLDVINDAIVFYQAALTTAQSRERIQVVIKNQARAALIVLLTELTNYVTFTANGNPAILISSGFDMRKDPEPSSITKPGKIQVTDGLKSGELTVSVHGVKEARGATYINILLTL